MSWSSLKPSASKSGAGFGSSSRLVTDPRPCSTLPPDMELAVSHASSNSPGCIEAERLLALVGWAGGDGRAEVLRARLAGGTASGAVLGGRRLSCVKVSNAHFCRRTRHTDRAQGDVQHGGGVHDVARPTDSAAGIAPALQDRCSGASPLGGCG